MSSSNASPAVPEKRGAFVWLFSLVLLFFLVSGACGLLYQVVWTRKLVLLFGSTAPAVSTVLSIFFLGLGLGSIGGGWLADRTRRPLWLYGIFEVIIGLWAVVFVLTVLYGEGFAIALLKWFDWSRTGGIALRALLALGLLLVPVSLMGATLPLLAKYVTRESRVRGLPIGTLYTVNTLGAVAGCFFTGFFLLERFGYTRTTMLGAGANVLVGLLAMLLGRREQEAAAPAPLETPQGSAESYRERPAVIWLLLAAFAISGFCALALEVLWTRLLAIVFLGTTYAYTTMLTTLLCGIVAGSLAASLAVDRLKRPAVALGGVLMATAICTLWTLGYIAALPEKVTELHLYSGNRWGDVTRGTFLLSFLALFPPTFCLGLTFPLVVKATSRFRESLGRDVGVLYSANTFGGVLGAIAGGFVIIPALGTHQGMIALAVLLFVAGALLLFAPPAGFRRMAAGVVFTGLFLLNYQRAPEDVSQALNAGYIPAGHEVIFFEEGTEGTVAVSQPLDETSGSNRILWINRVQATASIEKGVKMNRLQGALPLLFDRDPKNVLFMCFGSGITCGTLAVAGFEHIDAVEISPEVLEAAPLFSVDNLNVHEQPNVRFHVDDGRNFLLRTDNRYDVITFEPMPLALAGVSTFYTQEYYQLCLDRLTPGGLVSQWVPLHSLNPEVVQSLVYTFTTVFPDYTAWFINADLFLIGSNQPLRVDYARAQERLSRPQLQQALAEVWFPDAAEVIGSFILDKEGLDAFAAGGTVMRDDRPWAEFIAPKLVYERKVRESLEAIEPHTAAITRILAPDTAPEAVALLERRQRSRVQDIKGVQQYYGGLAVGDHLLDPFFVSLDIDPDNHNAQYYLEQIIDGQFEVLLKWGEFDTLETMLDRVLEYMPENPYYLERRRELQGARAAHAASAEP